MLAMPPDHDFESAILPLTFLHSFVSSDFKIASCRKRKAHATKMARLSAALAMPSPKEQCGRIDGCATGAQTPERRSSDPTCSSRGSISSKTAEEFDSADDSEQEEDEEDGNAGVWHSKMNSPRSDRMAISPPFYGPDAMTCKPDGVNLTRLHASLSSIGVSPTKPRTMFEPHVNPPKSFMPAGSGSPVAFRRHAVIPSASELGFGSNLYYDPGSPRVPLLLQPNAADYLHCGINGSQQQMLTFMFDDRHNGSDGSQVGVAERTFRMDGR
jgi:hypothetical protein